MMTDDSSRELTGAVNPKEPRPDQVRDYDYFECRECGFSSIQFSDFTGSEWCPLCAGDNGHDVRMSRRRIIATDVAEGNDARKST